MPSIAIVGNEGSGKTVLITMLAKNYAQRDGRGVTLLPGNRRTASYVERAWKAMHDEDWPPSTIPGELIHLRWTLHCGNESADVRLMDSAGQDLRILFSEEQVEHREKLPAELQQLAEYVRESDVVLLLVNLKDFIGEADSERRLANEWTLHGALDHLTSGNKPRHIAVAFTQIDQFTSFLPAGASWREIARQYLPRVYEAHLHSGQIYVFGVSAVGSTQTIADSTGAIRRVPQWNGAEDRDRLTALMDWLVRAVMLTAEANSNSPQPFEDRKAVDEPDKGDYRGVPLDQWLDWISGRRKPTPAPDDRESDGQFKWPQRMGQLALRHWGWLCVALALAYFTFCGGLPKQLLPRHSPPSSNSRSVPMAEVIDAKFQGHPGILWDTITCKLEFANRGAAGRFVALVIYRDKDGNELHRERKPPVTLLSGDTHVAWFSYGVPSGKKHSDVNCFQQVTVVP